jgi:hypothetical protein
MDYQNYLQQFTNQDTAELSQWLSSVDDKCSKDDIEHIIDYFMWIENPNYKLSFKEAKQKSEDWIRSMSRDTTDEVEGVDYEIVYTFDDWMRFVKLLTKIAYENESANMRHCIKTYWGNPNIVYSLRDKKNLPHATMDISFEWNKVNAIQGKGNNTVDWKYERYNIEFVQSMWYKVDDWFMKKLWYIALPQEVYKDPKKLLFWKWHFWELTQKDFKKWVVVYFGDYKWSAMPEVDVITGNAIFI